MNYPEVRVKGKVFQTDVEIPTELITGTRHDDINFNLLNGKTVIGLCGYQRCGKDTIADDLVDRYNYHRIAFADSVKEELMLIKSQILEDLIKKSKSTLFSGLYESKILKTLTLSKMDFSSNDDIQLKEFLRPYVIWFGEAVKRTIGIHIWTNRALEKAKNYKNIVFPDTRRLNELDLFMNGFNVKSRRLNSIRMSGLNSNDYSDKIIPTAYDTHLFYVNQYKITDMDHLTMETIQKADEEWLFDGHLYIDPIIPEGNRKKFIESVVDEEILPFINNH